MAYNNNQQPGEAGESRRLFTALWPDESARRALVRCRDRQDWPAAARQVAEVDWHVTLTFLGSIPATVIPVLASRLAVIDFPALELCFDRLECWGNGLVVLVPRRIPEALSQLHGRLKMVHRVLGLPLESRPYRPHITLARRAAGAALLQPLVPVRWSTSQFFLVESRPPEAYRILHRFCGSAPTL